jgi:hypothetical protein
MEYDGAVHPPHRHIAAGVEQKNVTLPSLLKSPVPMIDQAVDTFPTPADDVFWVPFMNQIATSRPALVETVAPFISHTALSPPVSRQAISLSPPSPSK